MLQDEVLAHLLLCRDFLRFLAQIRDKFHRVRLRQGEGKLRRLQICIQLVHPLFKHQ